MNMLEMKHELNAISGIEADNRGRIGAVRAALVSAVRDAHKALYDADRRLFELLELKGIKPHAHYDQYEIAVCDKKYAVTFFNQVEIKAQTIEELAGSLNRSPEVLLKTLNGHRSDPIVSVKQRLCLDYVKDILAGRCNAAYRSEGTVISDDEWREKRDYRMVRITYKGDRFGNCRLEAGEIADLSQARDCASNVEWMRAYVHVVDEICNGYLAESRKAAESDRDFIKKILEGDGCDESRHGRKRDEREDRDDWDD